MNISIQVKYNGVSSYLTDVLHEKGLNQHRNTICRRIQRGWSAQRAIDKPINKYK